MDFIDKKKYMWNSLSLSFIMIVVNSRDAVELLSQGRCERVSGQLMEVSPASLGRYCIVNLVHGLVGFILNVVAN